jgi:hypothetical protein
MVVNKYALSTYMKDSVQVLESTAPPVEIYFELFLQVQFDLLPYKRVN